MAPSTWIPRTERDYAGSVVALMQRNDGRLGPYATPEDLVRGKRRFAISLAVAAAAFVLAIVADRVVGDAQLVRVYLVAGGLHLVAAIGLAVRISRTGELERIR